MSSAWGDMLHRSLSKPQPVLSALPSEVRRLIVAHLAPDSEGLRPGSKEDLKNANLAHSCLREWVPEYMFRDMALKHVLVGISSHLERFAVVPANTDLLKLVKHIVVQVPPAVRWEIGRFDAFGHDLDKMTDQRLCSKFRVTNRREMTSEQLRYCYDYHIAMVEPFTDNRSWYRLQYAAGRSWAKIFNRFCNLESISVGCCDIVDQPSPTVTNTFVLQHGKGVIEEPYPPYIEDGAVNMAWASALVIRTAPRTVRDLRLSMANMDNFNSFATINRLQSVIQHGRFTTRTMMITRLSITLRGIAGTHGNKEWHGDTGSAGSVRHWTTLLNSLEQLQHLEFHNALDASGILQFSHMELSDAKGCILDWILPELASRHLRTLRLCGFLLDEASILNTLADRWVSLQNLILEDISLMLRYTENSHAAEQQRRDSYGDHLQGKSWLNIGRILTEDHPGVCIVLRRIASNVNDINDYALHPRYVKQLEALPLVEVDVAEPPSAWLKPPKDHHETEPEAS